MLQNFIETLAFLLVLSVALLLVWCAILGAIWIVLSLNGYTVVEPLQQSLVWK